MSLKNSKRLAAQIRHLRFETIAPGRPYHAALSSTEGSSARGLRFAEHDHDFYEMMFLVAGQALHGLNGKSEPIIAGDLVLLRPEDRHFIRFETGRPLYYINIAIVAEMWLDFHRLVGIPGDPAAPVLTSTIGAGSRPDVTEECSIAFRRALLWFQETDISQSELRTEACRLLSTVAPWLPTGGRDRCRDDVLVSAAMPPWLAGAVRKLQRDPAALRSGLPAFVAEAEVTGTHLARVLKATTGQTPTELVNRLRLESAARLLATTPLSILDISAECGFEQLSYFYRLFHARYETSPHAYRTAAARRVAPAPVPGR